MAEGLVLGLDTSTRVQAGIVADGQVLGSVSYDDPMRHVEQLAPLLAGLTAESGVRLNELSRVVVGVGPGPFTGLRVGIATARSICYALGIELRGVCSLDVLAAQWACSETPPDGEVLIATDARRQEVYWARYARDGRRIAGPAVSRPTELPELPIGGPATLAHPDLEAADTAPLRLDGGQLALLGGDLPDAGIEPLYLRNPDARPPGPRKSVLPRPRVLP